MRVSRRQADILAFLLRNSSGRGENAPRICYGELSEHMIGGARTRSSVVKLSGTVRQLERRGLIAFDRPVPKFSKVRSVFLTAEGAEVAASLAQSQSSPGLYRPARPATCAP